MPPRRRREELKHQTGIAEEQNDRIAFTFTVRRAVRDAAARRLDDPTSLIIAGIGSNDTVERLDSCEAAEARIRSDRTEDDNQRSE
ncbi:MULTISPECIES: hypothetical protein [Methylobacterium]|uniref:hypothetical protein n=1 Tax=Methylobacterium TaxID=407 RepID=UPI0013ED4611|nr:hypothetical protein [Methylobacterium sp. DB0501]NGM35869.1 hypothetical protein [Methylobacterium sp. DB0501]